LKRFLIIQTAFLGDVILATPIAEAIHQRYEDAVVHMLVRKGHESLLKNHPYIQQILTWDKRDNKYQELKRLIPAIRKEAYHEVINVQRFAATGLLTLFSGARQTAGFKKNPFSTFFSRAVPHRLATDNNLHEVDRNLSLVAGTVNRTRFRPRLYPLKEDYQAIATYQSDPYLVMAPASVWYTKQYPKEAWLALLRSPQIQPYNVYLVGAPDDYQLCDQIQSESQHPNIINLAGQLSLLQTAALMEKATLSYCNDSAPLHLASAMNAPVVSIFCSTIPEFGFGPLSDESYVIEAPTALSCRPCTNHGKPLCPRGHFRCAFDITPEQLTAPLPS
jgi:ADP-heptose:LPS heptosyltransferase